MTVRSRPPTDQQKTAIYDPERDQRRGPVEIGTPTEVTPPTQEQAASAGGASYEMIATAERPASAGGASYEMIATAERSEPIRVISMKAPAEASEERRPVQQHQPRLRRLSEVSPQRQRAATPPGGLGYLAPPRDPREVRTRRRREYLIWGSAVVILAVAVMLGVWFLAGM
jgi:hypothetical protein